MSMPVTLHEDVYNRIKGMIVTGELAPGAKLVLRSLASQLGTSTMPVVEAIRRLEHDGLVTQIPKWGAHVKEWTEEEKLEALHIRRALEGESARLFVLRATQLQKDELAALNAAFDDAARQDLLTCFEADVALHQHIARSTGFSRLAQLIEISKIPLTMFWKWKASMNELRMSDFIGCHERLIKVLLGDDPELAVLAMWNHVDGTSSLLNGKGPKPDESSVRLVQPGVNTEEIFAG